MKNIAKMICMMIALCMAASCAARAAEPDALTRINDIVYTERPGGVSLKGNITRPVGDALLPGIILVHGGGFVAGSKDKWNIPEIAAFLASHGYVVFSVDYRFLQFGGMFPENIYDVKCSVKWFRAHAAENGVDLNRIVIMGNSAGGYFASFMAVTQNNDSFNNASCGDPALDAQPPAVDLAVAFYGVHDFNTMTGNLLNAVELSYFRKIKDKKAFKTEISPVTYAASATPMLLIHGTADQLVPVAQSREMCDALKKNNIQCTLIEFPGLDHGFVDEQYGKGPAGEALEAALKWIDEQFAGLAESK